MLNKVKMDGRFEPILVLTKNALLLHSICHIDKIFEIQPNLPRKTILQMDDVNDLLNLVSSHTSEIWCISLMNIRYKSLNSSSNANVVSYAGWFICNITVY